MRAYDSLTLRRRSAYCCECAPQHNAHVILPLRFAEFSSLITTLTVEKHMSVLTSESVAVDTSSVSSSILASPYRSHPVHHVSFAAQTAAPAEGKHAPMIYHVYGLTYSLSFQSLQYFPMGVTWLFPVIDSIFINRKYSRS